MAGAHERAAIDAVLDTFHRAAAAADEDAFFSTLAPDAVFLGTAPGERWGGPALEEFIHGYFSRGIGWTYVPSDRSVDLDPEGRYAWFDETVRNDHYGDCRGTGALRQIHDEWRIAQYNLAIPIPDTIAPTVVAMIREDAGG